MNFDTSKKRLVWLAFAHKKKGENFFSFFSSFFA
jgi:hypothetical protein